VRPAFPDFPHDELDDRATALDHQAGEFLHAGDALRHGHRRPFTSAVVIGFDRRRESFHRFGNATRRIASKLKLFERTVSFARAYCGPDRDRLAGPALQFAGNKRFSLMDRRWWSMRFEIGFFRKKLSQLVCGDHVPMPPTWIP